MSPSNSETLFDDEGLHASAYCLNTCVLQLTDPFQVMLFYYVPLWTWNRPPNHHHPAHPNHHKLKLKLTILLANPAACTTTF